MFFSSKVGGKRITFDRHRNDLRHLPHRSCHHVS